MPKNPQQGNVAVIVLVAALLAAVGFGAFYYGKSASIKTTPKASDSAAQTTPTPSADETANWETYSNAQYKFELRHPEDWRVVSSFEEPRPQEIFVAYNEDVVEVYLEKNPHYFQIHPMSQRVYNLLI